jgi:hypothetical protein
MLWVTANNEFVDPFAASHVHVGLNHSKKTQRMFSVV